MSQFYRAFEYDASDPDPDARWLYVSVHGSIYQAPALTRASAGQTVRAIVSSRDAIEVQVSERCRSPLEPVPALEMWNRRW